MRPQLFIHIPKTAGTSLNVAAEHYYGVQAIEKDYGQEEPTTTQLVHDHIYSDTTQSAYTLYNAIVANDRRWLTGHVHAEHYAHLFGAANTLSFVRDPVARVISEHRHRVRHFNLTSTFADFYRNPAETNKQFRMIGQVPWQAFHLVGTLEKYDACLNLLKRTKNIPLTAMKTNVADADFAQPVDIATVADIKKWNERDCIFVENVSAYLAKRFAALECGSPFCFHDLGFIPDTHVIGWAFYENNEMPVHVGLFADGVCVEHIQATEHRPELQVLLTPRSGHSGFRFVLSSYRHATSIMIKALNTDQVLLNWSRET